MPGTATPEGGALYLLVARAFTVLMCVRDVPLSVCASRSLCARAFSRPPAGKVSPIVRRGDLPQAPLDSGEGNDHSTDRIINRRPLQPEKI